MGISILSSGFGLGILLILAYGILQWLHIPAGNLVDWIIGIASFWWLLVIVTVPWNIHFDARSVIAEAGISREKGISVDLKQVKYAQKIERWSLVAAIALHLVSGITLYILAAAGISTVGYISSGATILLTVLRPAIRTYEYIAFRLSMIRKEIKYPREDVLELRDRLVLVENRLQNISYQLDTGEENSWATQIEANTKHLRESIAKLQASLDQYQGKNELEHQTLSREAQNAISQLTEDSQVLSNVREIIRFFKNA